MGKTPGIGASGLALAMLFWLGGTGCFLKADDDGWDEPVAPGTAVVKPASADRVKRTVRNLKARAVMVNVWATWCTPCREEFPDLIRVYREFRGQGLRLVLVSADFEEQIPQVKRFLVEQGVDFPSYVKAGKDMEFIDGIDPAWSGVLPATWIYDASGVRRHFWEGKASYQTLRQKVADVLKR